MRHRLIGLAALALTAASALGAAEAQVQTYRIARTAAPPKIDGVLDDACWKDAPTIKEFFLLGGATSREPLPQTQAWLTYDDDYLYVAYRCAEPLSPNLLTRATEHDGLAWADDCVEIFFNPSGDRQRYVQIAINAAGVIMDAYYDHPDGPMDLGYETGAEAATKISDGVWTLEARIPFSGLPLAGPSGAWTFHLARTRANAGQWLTSLRSPGAGQTGGYHEVARFDVLEGISLPDRTVTLLDASPGELLPGRNIGRAALKNWGDRPAQVEVSAGIVGAQPPARGKVVVTIEPGKTISVEAPWELDGGAAGQRADIEARVENRLVQQRTVLVPKPADILGKLKTNICCITQGDFVRIDLPVNMTEATRPELRLRWEALDASGRTMGRGTTVVRDAAALIRLYWTGWCEGFYTLKFELARNDRTLASAERTIRLVNSPWGEEE